MLGESYSDVKSHSCKESFKAAAKIYSHSPFIKERKVQPKEWQYFIIKNRPFQKE